MEEIIKQIMDIDEATLNSKRQNEQTIKQKKESYENQIAQYKEEKMKEAQEKAQLLQEQIIETGKQEYHLHEEKSKKNAMLLENKYIQIENSLLDQVFEELFGVVG
ncbi:MAG: hypothetical protein AB9856_18265 [Cellulosilyticaceae bacterium]